MKLVVQNMSRVLGGNEKWLAILSEGLEARGHEVVVSCPKGAVSERVASLGIRHTGFRPRGVLDPVSGFSFAWWLRRERPDALLLTSWQPLAWSTFAARLVHVPKVVLRLGIVREFPGFGPRAIALRRGVRDVIVNSVEIRDVWQRTAPPASRAKVHVVLNAVESMMHRRAELREKLRGELNLNRDTLLIGGAGHLFRRKGFDILMRAFAASEVNDARLVIVGDGSDRPELETMAKTLGISDRVHWLRSRPDGPEVIAGLDAFVLSSHNEGMANVMLEAMAAGTPVIAFDVSGVRQAIGPTAERPEAGWAVPAGDEAALAAGIRTVASAIRSHSSLVGARTGEAHWRIEHWFGRERMIDECEAILFGT